MEELETLVTSALAGDLDAYGRIVARFQNMAYGYSYSALGDFQLAEDAAQEAFVDAHQRLAELRDPKAFPGWFRRIVVKHCDRIRRRRRETAIDEADEHPALGPEPDEVLERKELRERVLQAIGSLPEHQRSVTTLFYLDGYSQQEVSEFLEVPLTTVKKRLHDARVRLKERMFEMVGETLKFHPLHERFADVVAQMTFVRERINPLEEAMRILTDAQFRSMSDELRSRLSRGEQRDRIKAEAFALVREATRRVQGLFHFDVQLVAALMLDEGWVAEMAAGEGKTLCCYPAIFMAALEGRHVHVVTPNGYCAERDSRDAGRVLSMLGVEVGCLGAPGPGTPGLPPCGHQVTYGTYADFALHHLRRRSCDPAVPVSDFCCDVAIIDEIDWTLIDNGLTSVQIGEKCATVDESACREADAIAGTLIQKSAGTGESQTGALYLSHVGNSSDIELTANGRAACAELVVAGVSPDADMKSHIIAALRAHLHLVKNRDYILENGCVLIIDEETGRTNPARLWSGGLHQAVEVKEGLPITPGLRVESEVRCGEYFRQYRKLAGLTGTAMPQSKEFKERFGLKVARVPTRRALNRVDYRDRLYRDDDARCKGVVEEVRHQCRNLRRPVLVGVTSTIISDQIAEALRTQWGIKARILDARPENAADEVAIVKQIGTQRPRGDGLGLSEGAVTITSAMGGRGTNVKLEPGVVFVNCHVPKSACGSQESNNAAGAVKCCIYCDEYDEKTRCAHCFKPALDPAFPQRGRTSCRREVPCGLHVIGVGHCTQRNDEQLRRRAARAGEPGSNRFHVSMQDELIVRSADRSEIGSLLGLSDKTVAESAWVSRAIRRLEQEADARNAGTHTQSKAVWARKQPENI